MNEQQAANAGPSGIQVAYERFGGAVARGGGSGRGGGA
jgi:hypothetical protein